MRKVALLTAACAAMLSSAGMAQSTTLNTTYAADNFNDGIMFDLSVLGGPILLESFDINAEFGTFDYEIYYREGGIGGEQLNASAWTLLSSLSGVTTAGAGAATTLDVADLLLAAGTTYGFYITDLYSFSTLYTNSAAPSGTEQASDGAISIAVGYGMAYPFADATPDRAFNGGVTYSTPAVPEPATWLMMIAGFGLAGGAVRRTRRADAAPA